MLEIIATIVFSLPVAAIAESTFSGLLKAASAPYLAAVNPGLAFSIREPS